MNRRDFLKRMSALGLVAAAPPVIFDYGYKAHKRSNVTEYQYVIKYDNGLEFRFPKIKIVIDPASVFVQDAALYSVKPIAFTFDYETA